ncbi:MAG TPA: cytochrome c [Methylocystis sp.]|nr:cytochrome c [Methylocystis sp.]
MTAARNLLLFLAFPLLATPALARGDAEHGAVIAKRWCKDCHVVSNDQTSAKVDAPPFADIARRLDDKQIGSFLTNPHPRMPDMSLSRKEIEDLVSYIRSLDPHPAPKAPTEEKDSERPGRG